MMTPISWLPSLRQVAGVGIPAVLAGALLWRWAPWTSDETANRPSEARAERSAGARRPAEMQPGTVVIDADRQDRLGVRTTRVDLGSISQVLRAYGKVIPDEDRFAYLTPRAEGIVREVFAQIGQKVERGDLLARIDSQRVADARLGLVSSLQNLEIARAELNWQESIYQNAISMLDDLKARKTPEEIQDKYADRPVGKSREELMRSYSQYHLSDIEARRYESLRRRDAVSTSRYQQEQAKLEVDRAIFRGLMDRTAYEVTLEYTKARQALSRERTAVRVALETLRVLGVDSSDIVQQFQKGELTRKPPDDAKDRTLREATEATVEPSRDISDLTAIESQPLSTYELRAPFSGTILERERVVPGVVVNGNNRLFTMANLETVWVQTNVNESDYGSLAASQGGRIEFASPAYPGRTFSGKVLYTGDIVEEKSRTVLMIASADNPDRLLKPGMFVEVIVHAATPPKYPILPEAAVLTQDEQSFVFVRVAPDQFERRSVKVGPRREGAMAVLDGLKVGDEVVTSGAFELKAEMLVGTDVGASKSGGGTELSRRAKS